MAWLDLLLSAPQALLKPRCDKLILLHCNFITTFFFFASPVFQPPIISRLPFLSAQTCCNLFDFCGFLAVFSNYFQFFEGFFFFSLHRVSRISERFADLGDGMSPLQPRGVHWCRQMPKCGPHCTAAEGGEIAGGLQLRGKRPAAARSDGSWGQVRGDHVPENQFLSPICPPLSYSFRSYFVQKLIVVSLVVRFKKKKHPNSNLHVKITATHEEINNKDIFADFKFQKVKMVDNEIWLSGWRC